MSMAGLIPAILGGFLYIFLLAAASRENMEQQYIPRVVDGKAKRALQGVE